MNLERVWRHREEDVYPALFGPVSGKFDVNETMFRGRFRQTQIDPRWLLLRAVEFAPTAERPTWLYVTSGYSNPWEEYPADYNAEGTSGSGIEFSIQTAEQAEWAVDLLLTMLALDVLLAAGRLKGQPLVLFQPMETGPVNGDPSTALRTLMLTPAEDIPGEFSLPSGKVRVAGFTALTDAELAACSQEGQRAVLERLRAAGHHPVIRPERASIV